MYINSGGSDPHAKGGDELKFDDKKKKHRRQVMKQLGLDGSRSQRGNFSKWVAGLNAFNQKAYAMKKYGGTYGKDKKYAYEQRKKKGNEEYQRGIRRIQEEAPKIQQKMVERAELYNMFGG